MVRAHEGVASDLDRLPLDDPATYDLLCAADTIGCFRMERRAQQAVAPRHDPRTCSAANSGKSPGWAR